MLMIVVIVVVLVVVIEMLMMLTFIKTSLEPQNLQLKSTSFLKIDPDFCMCDNQFPISWNFMHLLSLLLSGN